MNPTGEPAGSPPSVGVRLLAVDPDRARVRRRTLFWARFSFVLVGTMPWWLTLMQALLPLGLVGTALELPFLFVCHQLPERTIHILGEAMPVCSRCSGIFTGLALGALTCWPRLTIKSARILLALGGLLMLADVATQDMGMHPIWHSTRLLTGGFLGWVGCAALMTAIINESKAPRPEAARRA